MSPEDRAQRQEDNFPVLLARKTDPVLLSKRKLETPAEEAKEALERLPDCLKTPAGLLEQPEPLPVKRLPADIGFGLLTEPRGQLDVSQSEQVRVQRPAEGDPDVKAKHLHADDALRTQV